MRTGSLLIPALLCFLISVHESPAQFVSQQESKSSPDRDTAQVASQRSLLAHARRLLSWESNAATESDRIQPTLQMMELIDQLRADSGDGRNPHVRQIQAAVTRRLRLIQRRLEAAERKRGKSRIEIDRNALHQLNVAAAARFNGGVAPPQQADYGPLLVSLIQETISPASWDVNGGKSTIVYYRPAMALVVRAPQSLHGRLGPLLGALRRE